MAALGAAILLQTTTPLAHAEGINTDFTNKDNWLFRLRAVSVTPAEDSITSIGGRVTADDQVVPEFDITYFWTDHIATELILAVTPHDMGAKDTAIGNVDFGDVWLLPPTLTLQYHFTPEQTFRPYVGAGINYTVFFNEDPVDVASIHYENGFGYDLQVGFDYGLNANWAINADVKKVFLNTDVKINGGAITADVDLDPWIFGVGVAYRF